MLKILLSSFLSFSYADKAVKSQANVEPKKHANDISFFSTKETRNELLCARALCNQIPETLMQAMTSNYFYDVKGDPHWAKLEKRIKDFKLDNERQGLYSIQLIEDWLNKGARVNSPQAARFFRYLKMQVDHKPVMRREGSKVSLDRDETRAKLAHLSKAEQDLVLDVFAAQIAESAPGQTLFGLYNSQPDLLPIVFPKKKMDKEIADIVKDIEMGRAAIRKNPELKFLASIPGNQEALTEFDLKKFKSGNFETAQLYELESVQYEIRKMLRFTTFSSRFSKAPFSFGEIKDLTVIRESVKKMRQKVEMKIATFEDRMTWDPDLGACKGAIAGIKTHLPTQQQVDDFKKQLPILQKKFRDSVSSRLSSSSAKTLEKVNWNISVSESAEKKVERLMAEVNKSTAPRNSVQQIFKKISPAARELSFAVIALVSDKYEDDKVEDSSELGDIGKDCKRNTPALIPDAAMGEHGAAVIGPYTVKNFPHTRWIINHEFAHILSHHLREHPISSETKAWYNASRECLIRNHTEMPPQLINANIEILRKQGNTPNAEEDWADMIGQAADPEAPVVCTGYLEPFHLGNPDPNARHSGALYRALHQEYRRKGGVPQSCVMGLLDRQQMAKFEDCLNPKISD